MRALPRHALGLLVLVGLGAAPTPGSAGPGLRELVFYATNPMDVRGMQRCPASSPFKPKPLCSLREAIEAANAVVGLVAVPVYVRLGAGQTYTLTMPVPLEISSGMTVERDPNDLSGPADPVIDGNATVDPLKVRAGVSASIKHVVIEHGASVGLRNAGRTTLRSVEVRDNCKAGEGAGVVNDGDLTIEASSIHDNACNNRTTGAGIVQWSGTTVMRDSDLRKNSLINGDGAAIDVEAGSFTFEGGAIDGNTSTKTTILSKGTLTIGPNAVFVNNTGPIWAMGPLRIIDSTITDNHFGAGVGFYECVVFNTAREAALLDGVLFARNDGPYCKQAGGNTTTILNSHFLFNTSNNFAGAFDEEQSADLDIQGSTFAYNKGRRAGAIFLSGFGVHGPNATLSDTHIHENESTGDGGGMTLHGYRVSLRDSDLDSNLAAGRGGAIFTESFFDPKGNDPPLVSSLTIERTSIAHNSAVREGGGISSNGRLRMTDTSIDDNQALIGGGVFSAIATWILPEASSLTRVTVSNNHGRWGGGITNALGTMNLVNATVSGNTTASDMNAPHTGGGLLNLSRLHGVRFKDDGGQWSWGGDLDSLDTTLRLFNVTVTDNASDRFGGIDNQDHLVIANSVVGDNHDWLGVDEPDCGTDPTFVMAHPNVPVYTSQGYSLLGNVNNKECGRLMDTDRIGTKGSVLGPRLMPLAHSGGFAQTHLLKVGSPLIDAANPGGCFDPEGHDLVEDQRGESRPFAFKGGEARCDVGAVELH